MVTGVSSFRLFFPLILLVSTGLAVPVSPRFIQLLTEKGLNNPEDVDNYIRCDGWRLSVETNNAGYWSLVPFECSGFVGDYMIGDHYLIDSEVVAADALSFAKTVNITGDGMDAWVFDIDETLLSNLALYKEHGFGSEVIAQSQWNAWAALAEAPALPASLKLYNEIKQLGFTIILLTGREENQRSLTKKNLLAEKYSGWAKLILRESRDEQKPADVYKSERRSTLIAEGYRIHGSCGDQWSDLLGFAVAERSFKLPNPMYYIP